MRNKCFLLPVVVLLLIALTACTGMQQPLADPAPEVPVETPMDLADPEPEVMEETPQDSLPPVEAPAVVMPLPQTVDLENLSDCTLAVSFIPDDFSMDADGNVSASVTVYVYDLYDMVDMSLLAPGGEIVVSGETVAVETVERNEAGTILLNGGLDQGGLEFATSDHTVYYEIGYSDARSYYPVGSATLPVSSQFLFTDAADLDHDPVVYDLTQWMEQKDDIMDHYVPRNTTIVLENGMVTEMERVYIP